MNPLLEGRLEEIKGPAGKVAVAFHHLNTGEQWFWPKGSRDLLFPSASLIKLPIMAACYKEAKRGKLFLGEKLSLASIATDGSEPFDDLSRAPLGAHFTVRKLVDRMITESDNTATNTLLERIGLDPVRALIAEWGLKETRLERFMLDWDAQSAGKENTTTAEDMLLFLLRLQRGGDFPAAWREEMWTLLTHQRDRSKMARRLDPRFELAHKTGELPGVRHDVGRIETKSPFLLAVLTEGLGEKGNSVIGRFAEAIAEHYAPQELERPLFRLGAIGEGIVTAPIVHLRRHPGHSSEMVSQALLGTIFQVLEKEGDWLHVQTPDGYLGWVRDGNVSTEASLLAEWQAGKVGIVFEPILKIKNRLLSAGSRLLIRENELFTPRDERLPLQAGVILPEERRGKDFIERALSFLGTPYLWGGKSGWGIDCSGLTQLAAFLSGIDLPRDADQQEKALDRIERDALEAGDLVFFPGHVGIYLGNSSILHASAKAGEVLLESLDPQEKRYNPWLDANLSGGGRLPA